jgi:prevent-host-death family protein
MSMSDWRTGEAKQRFSEVLREAVSEPQRIYNRDRLVAALVSAEEYEEFERWRRDRRRRTLGQAFDEVRELAARYGYELEIPERRDRETWADRPGD